MAICLLSVYIFKFASFKIMYAFEWYMYMLKYSNISTKNIQ